MLLASALLLAGPCLPNPFGSLPDGYDFYDYSKPIEATGPGLWIGGIAFAPADIASASVGQDEQTQQWEVEIVFASSGKAKFDELQRCRLYQPMEMSFDGTVMSRPVLNEQIMGNEMAISGSFTQQEVTDLVAKLKPAS